MPARFKFYSFLNFPNATTEQLMCCIKIEATQAQRRRSQVRQKQPRTCVRTYNQKLVVLLRAALRQQEQAKVSQRPDEIQESPSTQDHSRVQDSRPSRVSEAFQRSGESQSGIPVRERRLARLQSHTTLELIPNKHVKLDVTQSFGCDQFNAWRSFEASVGAPRTQGESKFVVFLFYRRTIQLVLHTICQKKTKPLNPRSLPRKGAYSPESPANRGSMWRSSDLF